MAVLTISASTIKSLLGITVSTYDTPIANLITATQAGIEGQIESAYLNSATYQPQLTLGVSMLIADLFKQANPSLLAAGPLIEERAGPATWRYADTSSGSKGSDSLQAQGMRTLQPYLAGNSALLAYTTAAKDIAQTIFDEDGERLAEGGAAAANLDLWDR